MRVREQSIKEEIYRVTKELLKKPRDTLQMPEESCLSAIEEYCRNELGAKTAANIIKNYYVQHPIRLSSFGCLTSIGLLGGSAYGFTQNVWLGIGGLVLTFANGIRTLRKPGRYEMARDQAIDVWQNAMEQARPKLEELLGKYK